MTSTTTKALVENSDRCWLPDFDPSYFEKLVEIEYYQGGTTESGSLQVAGLVAGLKVYVNSESPTQAAPGNESFRTWALQHGMNLTPRDSPTDSAPASEPDASLTELIDRFKNLPGSVYGARLATRLQQLLEIAREEQPEQPPPVSGSIQGFLTFLSKNPVLAYPNIVLTPEGNVRATWVRGRGQRFALDFLENGDAYFVIFAPDPRMPFKTTRVAGATSIDSVMELAAPYGVQSWIKDNEVAPAA